MATSLIVNGSKNAPITLVLAHGAGAPMDHPFMNAIAESVASKNVRVARFEFAYMAARRTEGKRGAP
ncbi:MAG TPA: alpha/beta family hydrolase, partial [Candidatus Binataceae bacterium]|nr:alpha/beta family hydrolase [Candidatus Binataceae bacterium]